jgi:hypothetical protein
MVEVYSETNIGPKINGHGPFLPILQQDIIFKKAAEDMPGLCRNL